MLTAHALPRARPVCYTMPSGPQTPDTYNIYGSEEEPQWLLGPTGSEEEEQDWEATQHWEATEVAEEAHDIYRVPAALGGGASGAWAASISFGSLGCRYVGGEARGDPVATSCPTRSSWRVHGVIEIDVIFCDVCTMARGGKLVQQDKAVEPLRDYQAKEKMLRDLLDKHPNIGLKIGPCLYNRLYACGYTCVAVFRILCLMSR